MRNAVKVLIVDDDKSSCAMLTEVVKRLGLKAIVAHKATDALNIVRLQTVHAAIVDVLLPKMSGVDLVLEFRKTKFSDNPVVFVSGVFKDKNFAADAQKKTSAVDFLFKPFGAEELMSSLRRAIGPLMTAERFGVQSLLTRKFKTPKDRAKAIEHLEPIRGLDFPYVLAFLLEARLSGHLNIVNDSGEIFGVKLIKGTIADVDSTESQSTGVLALISNGFLAQEDWDEYQTVGRKNFPLERLVQEGYVSPHAVSVAKHEQILSDFKAICSAEILQINFVTTDDIEEPPKHAVRMGELLSVFIFSIQEFFPQSYLADFYEPVRHYPLHLQQTGEEIGDIWNIELFKPVSGTKEIALKNGSLDEMLTRYPKDHERVYQCLHLLVLNGWVIFQDMSVGKTQASNLERYKRLYEQLKNKEPDEVLEYFGATVNASKSALDSLFEEYRRANSPSLLPKETSPELQEYCKKCFDLVQNAHAIMSDEVKRTQFKTEQRDRKEKTLRESNTLTAEALDLLRKGQFAQAKAKVIEAEALHYSNLQFLIAVWADVKSGQRDKAKLQEALRKLDNFAPEDRKSPYYFMAIGLVKKAMGDNTASGYFEKALQIDSLFVEARRELSASGVKKEKVDIFRDDITTVVTHLLKRKSE